MDTKPVKIKVDEALIQEATFIKNAWISWKVQFNELLEVEEIPNEKPDIEACLTDYLTPFIQTIKSKIKRNFSFGYTWSTSGEDPRSFILQVYLRHFIKRGFVEPQVPVQPLTIVKDDGRYMVIDDKLRKRSTKNTVKLTPPAT